MADTSAQPQPPALATIAAPPSHRVFEVRGDYMEPRLLNGDVAIVRPVDRYEGEGVYVVAFWSAPQLFRASARPGGDIQVYVDNPSHGDKSCPRIVTREQFDGAVLGRCTWLCSRIAD